MPGQHLHQDAPFRPRPRSHHIEPDLSPQTGMAMRPPGHRHQCRQGRAGGLILLIDEQHHHRRPTVSGTGGSRMIERRQKLVAIAGAGSKNWCRSPISRGRTFRPHATCGCQPCQYQPSPHCLHMLSFLHGKLTVIRQTPADRHRLALVRDRHRPAVLQRHDYDLLHFVCCQVHGIGFGAGRRKGLLRQFRHMRGPDPMRSQRRNSQRCRQFPQPGFTLR